MTGAALIVGASGVVGRAALAHFAQEGVAIGASRRPPAGLEAPHVAVDLSDAAAARALITELPAIDRVVFAALYEKPGLLAGWVEADQMETNRTLLAHCLDALAGHPIRHISLLQGTKASGAHVQRMRVPGREREPRVPHPNFYWLQEDLLRARAEERGFAYTIWRPPVIVGHALGAPMNVLAALAAYATIAQETGEGFAFPGGACSPIDAIDTRLLAAALAWAPGADAARNATFNVSNGDVLYWPDLWPALAHAFGIEAASPEPRALAEWLPARAGVWQEVCAREGLRAPSLEDFLGDSAIYADMLFGHGRDLPPPSTLLSTIALRKAGFSECVDSEDMFQDWIEQLRRARIIPARG